MKAFVRSGSKKGKCASIVSGQHSSSFGSMKVMAIGSRCTDIKRFFYVSLLFIKNESRCSYFDTISNVYRLGNVGLFCTLVLYASMVDLYYFLRSRYFLKQEGRKMTNNLETIC